MRNGTKLLLSLMALALAGTIIAQRSIISTQDWQLNELGTSNYKLALELKRLRERIGVMERWRRPVVMNSSWYGDREHGRKTANGETFNRYAYTVASRELAFGTVILIENPENGRYAAAVVNDRGPYIDGRQLDVSEALAQRLGFHKKGVTEVRVYTLIEPGVVNESQEISD